MHKEPKQKWIDALNSGDYEQGKYYLCSKVGSDTTEWCCLGVLTDLYQQETNNKLLSFVDNTVGAVVYGDSSTHISNEVLEWSGLTIEQACVCTKLNDGYNMSFSDIADVIATW